MHCISGLEKVFWYTVTKASQNEALLWKVEVLGMVKPPVDAGTFCPSPPFWYFSFLHAGNIFRSLEQELLRAVPGKFCKSLK
jgi:hypothetical protein